MSMIFRYCLALDLKEDENLILEYEEYHKNVWPEIEQSIKDSGILTMQIYRVENRLFMIMEVDDSFSFEVKNKMDMQNPMVKEWEELMNKFQKLLPNSKPGDKWRLMTEIYNLK